MIFIFIIIQMKDIARHKIIHNNRFCAAQFSFYVISICNLIIMSFNLFRRNTINLIYSRIVNEITISFKLFTEIFICHFLIENGYYELYIYVILIEINNTSKAVLRHTAHNSKVLPFGIFVYIQLT